MTEMRAGMRPPDAAPVGRRFLIAVGIGEFDDPQISPLPAAAPDAARFAALLAPHGYVQVLPELARAPRSDELRRGIGRWTRTAELGPADVVVVYFAGHGVRQPDRHYLLCRDSELDDPASTALADADLSRALLLSAVGHLLVVFDTCFADAGALEVAALAGDLAAMQGRTAGRAMLASARVRQSAREGALVDALARVLAEPRVARATRYLSVREVTARVNEDFVRRRLVQRARHSLIDGDGQEPFFPNPAHELGQRTDVDIDALTTLADQARGHLDPRSRGLGSLDEHGDYFTGRSKALALIDEWLCASDTDHRIRVVTGNPGSGKSALLGRVLRGLGPVGDAGGAINGSSAINAYGPAVQGLIPIRTVDGNRLAVVPLHAHRSRLEDLNAQLAAALGLGDAEDLLGALGRRERPIVVLVDSLDEAGGDGSEAARIAHELLRPMAALRAVRLLVGTRRNLLPALGTDVEVIDLDSPVHVDARDLAEYASALLLDAYNPDGRSPYRGRSEEARLVAAAIARRAGTSFLVARMTARAIVQDGRALDISVPGWERWLPGDAHQAFATYLDRFGADRVRVERLLRPLAYAQGNGLPEAQLWPALAAALSDVPCGTEDVTWLLDSAGACLIGTADSPGVTTYRLFHETMAEYLRVPGREQGAQRAIAEALLSRIPEDPTGRGRDWAAADHYVRAHLATHAAAAGGGLIDRLVTDPEFLVHASPASLLTTLSSVDTPEGHAASALYRTSDHSRLAPEARRQLLAIDAARHRHPFASALAADVPWTPRWATGGMIHPAQRAVFTGSRGVSSCAFIDGRPHGVGFAANTLWLRDLLDGSERSIPTGHKKGITSLACTVIDGRAHALTTGHDSTARVYDLTTGSERSVLIGHVGGVWRSLCVEIDGHPHGVTAGVDATVRVWDLVTGTPRSVLVGHSTWVYTLAYFEIHGRPCAVTSDDQTVRIWDLMRGVERTDSPTIPSWVRRSTACIDIYGQPHLVSNGIHATVSVWNLADGTEHLDLDGHTKVVRSLACVEIDGIPHAVTGGGDQTVRVWDLTSGVERNVLTGHSGEVYSITCTEIDGRPHAISSAGSETRVWDLSRLAARGTAIGHTNLIRDVTTIEIDGRQFAATGGVASS